MMKSMKFLVVSGAVAFSLLAIDMKPAAAQNNPYTHCRGNGTAFLYVVPTNRIRSAGSNLAGCNIGGGLGYPTLARAIAAACGRMGRIPGETAANWPQTWQADFEISFSC